MSNDFEEWFNKNFKFKKHLHWYTEIEKKDIQEVFTAGQKSAEAKLAVAIDALKAVTKIAEDEYGPDWKEVKQARVALAELGVSDG